MSATRVALLLACLAGAAPAWGGPGDLEDDARRLEGKWVNRAPGLVWEVNFQVGQAVQIGLSGSDPPLARTGVGRLSAVQEDAHGRFVEMEEHTVRAVDLPRRLYFRFDGDDLVLDVGGGPLAGEHRFVRDVGPGRSSAPWVAGGLLLAAVLLIAAVVLLRRRSRTAAEPGVAPDLRRQTDSGE
jgi:hypothetical protein